MVGESHSLILLRSFKPPANLNSPNTQRIGDVRIRRPEKLNRLRVLQEDGTLVSKQIWGGFVLRFVGSPEIVRIRILRDVSAQGKLRFRLGNIFDYSGR
jgi:hypothetical protein